MTDHANRQLLLARRPVGMPEVTDFRLETVAVPAPEDGQAVVRVGYVSVDPTMRIWMSEMDGYMPPVGIGEVMRAGGVGQVVSTRSSALPEGAWVSGLTGWQDYAVIDLADPMRRAGVLPDGVPLQAALGVLGATGCTAYFGLLEVGRPQAGETVVVSTAAGATGSVVAQIAKIQGCRVVGIAGGPDKCAWVSSLGVDAVIDYKSEDVAAALREACPDGIDVYFDNVGGPILDACLGQLAMRGRVVLCGAIASYAKDGVAPGPANYLSLLMKRGRMEGFIVTDYVPRFREAVPVLAQWVAEGRLQHREHVVDGLENAPEALRMLLRGENTGKLMVKVDPGARD